jgi:predicted GH43/DUF377 family glycosyl hydrolase
MNPIRITRHKVRIRPNPDRVITKPFKPGEETFPDGQSRARVIIDRILAMPETDVAATLQATEKGFADRHRHLGSVLDGNFTTMAHHVDDPDALSAERRRLIGAYFTHEYSVEAAALTNPSIVPAPDQSGLEPGEQRFIMSLRAIGEGHISSIEFRSGVISAGGEITMDEPSPYANTGCRTSPIYLKHIFTTKLEELGAFNDITRMCLDPLPAGFTFEQLEASILDLDRQGVDRSAAFPTTKVIHWLASSNYQSDFSAETDISERVIFPAGPTESHGMEDARFVRFARDGTAVYYATYTAYDGIKILPQLIETADFVSFRIATLNGRAAQNKGIALFPRKIGGQFAALSREDAENNFLMLSNDVRFWHESQKIQIPERPWELTQLGNCGSPLETEAGWLVITHGVGPMRRYSLGAILLDRDDPCRVIGHLKDPLLTPIESERDGYVPNVVYSCGSMIHNDLLVIPIGVADSATEIATASLEDILTRLTGK